MFRKVGGAAWFLGVGDIDGKLSAERPQPGTDAGLRLVLLRTGVQRGATLARAGLVDEPRCWCGHAVQTRSEVHVPSAETNSPMPQSFHLEHEVSPSAELPVPEDSGASAASGSLWRT